MIVRIDHGAPGMGAQTMQQRREIGVARQDNELIEAGFVVQKIADIHDDTNIGGILELCRQRRAIDNFEPRLQEVMAHERKRIHVRRVIVRIAARDRIAVTAVHDDAALAIHRYARRRRNQAARQNALQPVAAVFGKSFGGVIALAFER